ncbi:L,D-transpeptidase [Notoacmeibacter sp. MSK16QG-6]|uniref:L,D-transpeptidase family protein n=1 Tax=Notoacmeibacter sp. MSK16QG-6 TaxID=2957982 RepID=UPI0020A20F64|nr:L,D-transpeptidase [Notoacmeibacter sp. MSK16QG-6]MCP1199913.1 L,D-transpeptidase [Notoacmeibacter sp. MSK16QG-6]
MMRQIFGSVAAGVALFSLTGTAISADLSMQSINEASYEGGALPEGQSPVTTRIQILLDRNGSSPGVIDGYSGGNVQDALTGFEEMNGFAVDGKMDDEIWNALAGKDQPAMMEYTIQAADVDRLKESNPDDYEEMAKEDWLGFTSGSEALAEKFHMDEDFLKTLNPDSQFKEGETIVVADPGQYKAADVARIVADKGRSRILAYDGQDKLVLSYPTTIGSDDTPSPSGTVEVNAVAVEPTYTFDPKNIPESDIEETLAIPAGPNGPVGLVWIDLSKPTYGLHGTPYPAEIGKTASHGCVRLTNWDAMELAEAVEQGATVEFKD